MSLSRTESSNHNFEKSIQVVIVLTIFMAFLFLVKKVSSYFSQIKQQQEFKNKRDNEGFTKEDRVKKEKMWDEVYTRKAKSFLMMSDQTLLFFTMLGNDFEKEFKSSTRQIIQFGIGDGEYVAEISRNKKRKIIGYDFSAIALDKLNNEPNVKARFINLNAIDKNKKLCYQEQLEEDFSVVSDVLLIRVLEYLDPEAVKLLMISIMDLAKPGSRFYVEIFSPLSDRVVSNGEITFTHEYSLKPGMISSLFAKRNDITIKVLNNTKTPNDKNEKEKTLERLLIKKNY